MIYHVIYTAKTGEVLSQYMNYPDIPTCEERLKALGATRLEIGIDLWSVPGDDMEIEKVLQQMLEVNAAVQVMRMDYEAKRAEIMATVQEQLDALSLEYEPLIDTGRERLQALEAQAKEQVILRGQSAKVNGLAVTYVKGRTSWDTKALDGYAAAHPEIEKFRTDGNPSARVSWK